MKDREIIQLMKEAKDRRNRKAAQREWLKRFFLTKGFFRSQQ